MKNITELRAKRSTIALEIKDQLDASSSADKRWEAADQDKYDAKMAEIDALDKEISAIQAYLDRFAEDKVDHEMTEHFNAKTKPQDSAVRALYAKYIKHGEKAITAEEWQSIRNTLSTGTGSQGGYTVQTEIASTLIEALKAFGGMREAATVLNTEMGNPLSFPTTDGTSEVGELIAENTTATAADPSFGTVSLSVYKFSSKIVAIPFELLQDSQINVEAFVNGRLIDRLGRITNTYFTTGTGSSQPNGVVTGSTAGKVGTTGQTLTVIADDLIDLIHSIDPAYRIGGCRFMMNDASLKVIRKLKDTAGRPIYMPGYDGLSGPMADSLLGYPITINQDIAVMAANAKSILFGDFSKYVIRDVMGATLFRFDDSAYIKLGQIGFLMWMRAGGNLLDTNAVKYYQNSAS
jgi:HK97 family phage major capsid protein